MRLLNISLVLVFTPIVACGDEPIPIADAVNRVGQNVTIKMDVKSAVAGKGIHILNSEVYWQDTKNLVVVISPNVAEKFRKANIENPAAYFRGRTIIVTGTITLDQHKPQIKINDPEDIIVDDSL